MAPQWPQGWELQMLTPWVVAVLYQHPKGKAQRSDDEEEEGRLPFPSLAAANRGASPNSSLGAGFCFHVGDNFKSCPMEGMMGRMLLSTKPLAGLCLAMWFLGGGGRLSLLQHFPRQLPGLF